MRFRIWVAAEVGALAALDVQAPSRDAAARIAEAQGLTVIETRIVGLSIGGIAAGASAFDLALFTEELLALLEAGLSLVEGLRALLGKADARARVILDPIMTALSQGKSLADALEQQGSFPDLYVSLVRAAERTSDLPNALQRYLAYARQMEDVQQRVISAAMYPALVTLVGTAAIAFLLVYVIPRFTGIYASMHGNLPWGAIVLMRWGELVKDHGAILALGTCAALGAAGACLIHPGSRRAIAARAFALPGVGEEVRLFYLARFYRTVGMLLEAGVVFTRALDMSNTLLPENLRPAGMTALVTIRAGERPSVALQSAGLSTAIAEQMLAVGERGGELGRMMARIAEFYEAATARKLQRLMRVLEPLLMTLIGVGIGGIVVLMYLPIFELAGAIQ